MSQSYRRQQADNFRFTSSLLYYLLRRNMISYSYHGKRRASGKTHKTKGVHREICRFRAGRPVRYDPDVACWWRSSFYRCL